MAKLLSGTRIYGTATVDTQLFVSGSNTASSTITGALQIVGGIGVGGAGYFGGNVTAPTFIGNLTGTATFAVTATFVVTATNVAGGAAGSVHYQSATGTTAMLALGTNGYVLTAGATAPQWTAISGLSAGLANTATNIAGGTQGQVPYQTAPNVTSFFGPGTAGQILISGGTGSPSYVNTSTFVVGRAVLADTATLALLANTATLALNANTATLALLANTATLALTANTATLALLANTATLALTANTATLALLANTATLALNANTATLALLANTATNVAGGATGSVLYQGATGTTAMLAIATTAGYVLSSTGSVPQWSSLTSLGAGSASNIAGGTQGQVPYQTAPGTTSFFGPGTAGNVLVSNGTSAPTYQNTLTLAGTTAATSTQTGALIVSGGVGIGGNLYVAGDIVANKLTIQLTTVTTTLVVTDDVISTYNTTVTYSTNTGALTVAGGVGVGGNMFVGGTVTATTFVGNLTGNASSADQVKTQLQTGSGTYYPVFVNANNASATAMSEYTTSTFTINPATGVVGINGVGGTALNISVPSSNTDRYFLNATAAVNSFSIYDNANTVYLNSYVGMTLRANQIGGSGGNINLTGGSVYVANKLGVGISSPASIFETEENTTTTEHRITNTNTTNTNVKYSRLTFRLTDTVGTRKDAAYITAIPINQDSSNGDHLAFFTRTADATPTEKLRITNNGGISFGASGTAYGTSGQILQSNGNAAPTWVDPSTVSASAGTVATVAQSASANYYLTFVANNNGSAAQSSVYTSANLFANPSNGNLTVAGYNIRTSSTINMSALSTTTFYPVIIPLDVFRTLTRLRIQVDLNSNQPAWGTHPSGFSINLDWSANGAGWGTTAVNRIIHAYTESWTSQTICGGIQQFTNSSYEVVYLRGGGNYYFESDGGTGTVPFFTATSTVYNGQTIAPSATVVNNVWAQGAGSIGLNTAYLTGPLLVGSTPSAGTSGYILQSNGSSAPSWIQTLGAANGGTGVNTLTGVAYGNGTGAFTAATGAQISTALGSTNISGSAANVTGIVATNNGGTGLSSWTAGDLPYYVSGTALTKLAIGTNGYVLTSSGSAPQWTAVSSLSIATATKATNIAGGLANQIPYQSAPDSTTFSGNFTWTNSINTLGVVGTINATAFTRTGNISASAWTIASPIFHSAAAVLTDSSTAASSTVSARVGASLFSPNFAATNASVTINDAVNLYIQEPVANTNITITNNWALWSAGNSFIGKSEKITTSLAVGSYSIPGTTGNIVASGSLGVGVSIPGYKVDVAGSIMATQGYSDVSGTNSALRLLSPGGASSWQGASSVTGAIKIKLPTGISVSNTMLRFTVKVYTYDGLSFDISCGGYTYTTAPGNWINTFAYMITQSRTSLNVRFGYDSGTANYCVYIGELATVWSYCNVFVTDFQAGYSNYTASTWNSGWAVSFEASAFANVTATQTTYPQLTSNYTAPAPALNSTYVGFGSASNLLTGSGSLTWNGSNLYINGTLSAYAADNTTINFSNADSDNATYTNRGGRVLTSNGANWVADGTDPILTLTRNNAGTTRGKSIGLLLHNENNTTNSYSPLIGFSALSNSSGYNSMYAAIMGKKTGQNGGVDSNWNKGELHFYTAGDAYMVDTPTATLTSSGWGINTSPSARLHLGTTADGESVFRIAGTGSTNATVKFADVDIGGQGYGGSYLAWGRGGSYDNWFMVFTRTSGNSSVERLRITANGGFSFGSGGTNYGSAGQILQSNGDAAPTWVNPSGLTAASATTALRIVFIDGPRDLSDRLPNSFTRTVNWDFVNAASATGTAGNYAGVMTFSPWTGTTASTGDGSYQLAFGNASGTNASGQPALRIRTGIDSTWNAWYTLLHAGNVGSYTAGAITNFTAATSSNPLDATSPATLDAIGYVNANIPTSYGLGGSVGSQSDGGLYVAGYSTNWYHEIYGDFRTGGIAVRGKYSGTWQAWRSVPCITVSDSAPSIYNNGDLWWQSSTGRLKVLYYDGNSTQWVDAVPVINTSLFFSKSGGAISGPVSINGALDVTGNINATGEITAYYSDRRLKTDIVTIENALVKVKKLNGVTYRPNDLAESFGLGKETDVVGLFADEVEKVLPQAVKPAPFDIDENGVSKSGENYKTIQYEKVVPLLVEAIKEQQSIIEAQQAKIDRLMKHLGLGD